MKISCPQCGAELQLDNPDSHQTCTYCKNSLYIDLDKIIAVFTFKETIDPHQISSYLKKDFKKMGFAEDIRIFQSIPVYFPFWQLEGAKVLKRGSSSFPADHINLLSANRLFFDASKVDYRTEVVDIDTQPQESKKRILIYCPFFKVIVIFREKKYHYFVNAVTGEVHGEPIPFISGKDMNPLFVLFLIIFVGFLGLNYFIDHFIISVALNGVLFYVFFQVSFHFIERRVYKE
ncbi:MAG: hypothetical protein KAT17_03185 [Candidatus Aminicenantes bacterium]|nr:hypothetical protein [Candidatus Aminicenantes bacterium]